MLTKRQKHADPYVIQVPGRIKRSMIETSEQALRRGSHPQCAVTRAGRGGNTGSRSLERSEGCSVVSDHSSPYCGDQDGPIVLRINPRHWIGRLAGLRWQFLQFFVPKV